MILVLSALVSLCILLLNRPPKKERVYSARVFDQATKGWGYEILVNGKLFIRQAAMPVYNGDKGFSTAAQAMETASLIINKMKNGQAPTVTIFDITQICTAHE